MITEEFIKNKINKTIIDLKEKAKLRGITISEKDELLLRTGIEYGIQIAGLALVNINIDNITINEGR